MRRAAGSGPRSGIAVGHLAFEYAAISRVMRLMALLGRHSGCEDKGGQHLGAVGAAEAAPPLVTAWD